MNSDTQYISSGDPAYPALLSHISDPPEGLWFRGEFPSDDMPKAAIIGSRACSEYGISVATLLARDLAKQGVAVISGMARGIDAAAHKAAIEAGGKTIAVLGSGVDVCYPPEHDQLMEQIINNGVIISEYPPGTKPERYFFPQRNRIISGLSNCIVVVEAAEKSGTSVTVGQALEQGRDVFAVPGSIYSRLSKGTNELIKMGAIPATCADDILRELKSRSWHKTNCEAEVSDEAENIIAKNIAPEEKLVYDCVGLEGAHVDEIIGKSGLPAATVQYLLVKLEIAGYVKRLAGGRFARRT